MKLGAAKFFEVPGSILVLLIFGENVPTYNEKTQILLNFKRNTLCQLNQMLSSHYMRNLYEALPSSTDHMLAVAGQHRFLED